MAWERFKKKSLNANLERIEAELQTLSVSVDIDYFSENRKLTMATLEAEKHAILLHKEEPSAKRVGPSG